MTKCSAFIADIHLHENNHLVNAEFERYIKNTAPMLDSLYILGDLFDYWVGDDHETKFNQHIINLLRQLTKTTKLYFMHGNRDFLIGEEFIKQINATLLEPIKIIEIYDKKIILTHGDLLCTNDNWYQIMRKVVHNKVIQKTFLCLPTNIRKKIAQKIRDGSKTATSKKNISKFETNHSPIKKIIKQNQAQILIHGHVHRTEVAYENSRENYISITIPDWTSNKGKHLLLCSNGEMSLELIYKL